MNQNRCPKPSTLCGLGPKIQATATSRAEAETINLATSKSYPVSPARWGHQSFKHKAPHAHIHMLKGPKIQAQEHKMRGDAKSEENVVGSDGIKRAASSRTVPDCEMFSSSRLRLCLEGRTVYLATTVPKHTDATLYSRKKSSFRDEG